jgi:hypothetical protein
VQDTEKTDLGSQMFRVGRDLQHGRCAGAKQEVIEDLGVTLAEWNQLVRQGEHEMKIGHAEQFLFSRGEPALARLSLALGAVPVPAAVIGDGLVAATRTVIDVPAQGRRAAASDGAQHF